MASDLMLVDTNILIRWVQSADPEFPLARNAVQQLEDLGVAPCYTSQNLAEFWNVLTRPRTRNGYGLTIPEVLTRTECIEGKFQLLPDSLMVHQEWRRLLVTYRVCGVQVHDARLVAAMNVHRVPRILTFNTKDFARFGGIEAVHPAQLS
jgi:predicted nucleic acid-binding protein